MASPDRPEGGRLWPARTGLREAVCGQPGLGGLREAVCGQPGLGGLREAVCGQPGLEGLREAVCGQPGLGGLREAPDREVIWVADAAFSNAACDGILIDLGVKMIPPAIAGCNTRRFNLLFEAAIFIFCNI